ALGHKVRLLPPIYVKPFVKRQKNDAAIAEAASRPIMRFVAVKTAGQQADAMIFRTRDLRVRQRTRTVNALRGHLAEFGIVAPLGRARVDKLIAAVGDTTTAIPDIARELARMMLAQVEEQTARIDALEKEIRARAPKDAEVARLMTIPGVGAISATVVRTFCPDMGQFRSGRDFAAWIGLTPKQNSTGGKARLGGISKMGQRDIWRLLIVVTLANKMARTIWTLTVRGEGYRKPAPAARSAARVRRPGECRQGRDTVRAAVEEAGSHKFVPPQALQALQARKADRDAIRTSPYRPAARDGRTDRPDTRPHLTAQPLPDRKSACIHGGIYTRDGS
ncbi:MAG: IS110 family transposase, partial [Acetobacteraceae bacterium]|nr:IS110 family transposase [Acetobacteraceae bacterium]